MLAAIRHGLGNITRFDGRDARQAFWYYVLFLYLVSVVMTMAVTLPMTMQAVVVGVEQGMASASNPDRVQSDAMMQAALIESMGDYAKILVWMNFAAALVLFVGLAASLVRRLHDADMPGTWALLPGAMQLANLLLLPTQLGNLDAVLRRSMSGNPLASITAMGSLAGLGAILGYGAIILVIIIGTRPSTPGPNRYGKAPFVA